MRNKDDSNRSSGLGEFKALLRDFRSITGYAVGGAGTLPIVAAISGIAPPWPPSIGPITSIFIVISLVIIHQRSSGSSFRRATAYITLSAMVAVIAMIVFLGMRDIFTFQLPTTQKQIIIGCGYTREAVQVADRLHIDVGSGCPGEFHYLLSTASFDNYRIWTQSSLLAIKLGLFTLWLLFFLCLTVSMGVFIVNQKARRGRPIARGSPKAKQV
jgi:hypothetical protein